MNMRFTSRCGCTWLPEVRVVHLQGKIKVMRYTVKLFKWDVIRNVINTDDISRANKIEQYLINEYGKDNVWICDNLQEVMVG